MTKRGALGLLLLLPACLGKVDPHTFGNFASRIELQTSVSNLGVGTDGINARTVALGATVAVFSDEFESFLSSNSDGTKYLVAVLKAASRDVSRATPFIIDDLAYMTPRNRGVELAAGFAMSGSSTGGVLGSITAPSTVSPTGVGFGDSAGFVFLLRDPAELWAFAADHTTRVATIAVDNPDDYFAVSRLPNGIVLAVKANAITAFDLPNGTQRTLSLERATPLPVTRGIPPFGAILPYAADSAFVVEGGRTIYNVRGSSLDDLTVLVRQEKATNARSLALDASGKNLVVANGIGGVLLFDSTVPESLVYLNRATATNIASQVSYNPIADSFALATNPEAAIYKIYAPE